MEGSPNKVIYGPQLSLSIIILSTHTFTALDLINSKSEQGGQHLSCHLAS